MVDKGQVQNLNNIELLLTLPDILLLSVEMARKHTTISRPHCLNLLGDITPFKNRWCKRKCENHQCHSLCSFTRLSSLSRLNIERTEK